MTAGGIGNPKEQSTHVDCMMEACGVCRELAQVEEEAHNLTKKRIRLNNSRNAIHDRLASKLPLEIISQIFIFVDHANNYTADLRPATLSAVYFCTPVILSSVCRRWREIALSLPRLWTNLCINTLGKADPFIEEWLNRGSSLPLHLTLYATQNDSHKRFGSDSAFDEICEVLRLHSARWTYLSLEYAPLGGRILSKLFSNLKVMPRSDSFDLHLGAYNQFVPVDLKTPNNLTCLSLSNYPLGDVLNIIKSAPKLTHCVSQKMGHGSTKKATPVRHERLEDLELSFRAPGTNFFQNLTTPSLRRLRYNSLTTTNSHWHDEDFHGLVKFVVRSELRHPYLQSFTLGWNSASLPNCNTTSFLRVLEVTCVSINSDMALSFLPKLSDVSIFPTMQELRLRVHSTMMGPEICAAICDFIEEHNSKARSAAESGKKASSGGEIPSDNTTGLNPAIEQVKYRRTLKTIVLNCRSYSLERHIKMTKDTFSRLRDAQATGPLRVCFLTGGDQVDMLSDPRCLENDGSIGRFVVLKSLAS